MALLAAGAAWNATAGSIPNRRVATRTNVADRDRKAFIVLLIFCKFPPGKQHGGQRGKNKALHTPFGKRNPSPACELSRMTLVLADLASHRSQCIQSLTPSSLNARKNRPFRSGGIMRGSLKKCGGKRISSLTDIPYGGKPVSHRQALPIVITNFLPLLNWSREPGGLSCPCS